MSDFAFYNATSEPRRGYALTVVPAQRLIRRLLRPAFFRLRDLLQMLFHRQEAQAAATAALAQRMAASEDAHRKLAQAHRALILDHTAVSRRVVMLEDLLIQSAAGKVTDPGESAWIIPFHEADGGRGTGARLAS